MSEKLENLGLTKPTAIQRVVIPRALHSENILAQSQTGSGKTLAYLLPIIEQLNNCDKRALILAPTRELAQQISDVFKQLCDATCATIYGGVEYEPQRIALAENPSVIIATVGRLLDLMNQGVAYINNLSIFVLDEVDQMVDLGFRDDIIHLSTLRATQAQTLCFSATLSADTEDIITRIMPTEYFKAENKSDSLAVDKIEQQGFYCSMEMMDHLLIHLLKSHPLEKGIIFTRSKKMADRISVMLQERDIHAEAMHSDRSQSAREHILTRFKSGETHLLVATDVIARGIDVDDVDVVYNYGMPLETEQYIHRIGRTARAGREGKAITLTTPEDKPLIDKVCKLMRRNIVMSTTHPYVTPEILKALLTPKQPRKRKK